MIAELEAEQSRAEQKRELSSAELEKRESLLIEITQLKDHIALLATRDSHHPSLNASVEEPEYEMDDIQETSSMIQSQKNMIEKQDEQLESLSQVLRRQKNLGLDISEELDRQSELLEDLDDALDGTNSKLKKSTGLITKITKKVESNKPLYGVLCLTVLMIVLFCLLFLVFKK